MLKLSSHCSGIGALEQAVKNLGIPHKVVFFCEKDKYAKQTYEANHKAEQFYEDMTTEEWDKPEQYSDLSCAGIPCQSFSLAGKRLGELDKRGLLFYDYYKWVKNQQPKVFIIENVKGLLSDAGGKTFSNWLLLLGNSVNGNQQMFNHPDSLGYNLHHTVLNSKNFGVPQNRERVFIVGVRSDLPNDFRFPIGWKLDKRLKDILETNVDEKYYLSDKMVSGLIQKDNKSFINQDTQASQVHNIDDVLPTLTAGTHGYCMGYIPEPICVAMRGRNPENPSDRATGAKLQQTLEPNSQGITNTITSVQKDNLIVEPELKQIAQLEGFESEGRIYDANGLARTIKDGGGGGAKTGWYQQGTRIRRLTPLECSRLQAFPDSFVWPVSDSQRYKQCGNSITVNVIQAIIKNLLHLF